MTKNFIFYDKSPSYYLYCVFSDAGMLESGLYPALKRQPEVGEVLAAPRRYYSGTKYIR